MADHPEALFHQLSFYSLGPTRNEMIHRWATAVRQAFAENEPAIEELLKTYPEVGKLGS